jgi:hypothetical protein
VTNHDEPDISTYSLAALAEAVECLAGHHAPECETTAVALADLQRAMTATGTRHTLTGYAMGHHDNHAAYQLALIECLAYLGGP